MISPGRRAASRHGPASRRLTGPPRRAPPCSGAGWVLQLHAPCSAAAAQGGGLGDAVGSPQKWQRGCKCKGKLGTAGHGTKHTQQLKHRIIPVGRDLQDHPAQPQMEVQPRTDAPLRQGSIHEQSAWGVELRNSGHLGTLGLQDIDRRHRPLWQTLPSWRIPGGFTGRAPGCKERPCSAAKRQQALDPDKAEPFHCSRLGSQTDEATDSLFCCCQWGLPLGQDDLRRVLPPIALIFTALKRAS